MPPLPVISGKQLLMFLQSLGFGIVRIKGSHHRLKHPDGRVTTVPVHKNQDIPKGLLRKIIPAAAPVRPEGGAIVCKSFDNRNQQVAQPMQLI